MTRQRFGNSGSEEARTYAGRRNRTASRVPVVHCHGALVTVRNLMDTEYIDDFKSIAQVGHPVITADLGGASTWGNDLSIGRVDTEIAWAAGDLGTRTDRVALIGDSMGGITALAWAIANPGVPRAIVLRSPVVAFEAFYNRNAVFQGPIDTAYGGHANWLAALDNKDPMRNIDKLRPLGDHISIWYATSDDYIPQAEIETFAALVGADLHIVSGEHESTVNVPPDGPGFWMFEKLRQLDRQTWDWSQDWDLLNMIPISNTTDNFDTSVGIKDGHGRRGYWTGKAGVSGNDRRVYELPEFQAVDSEIFNVIDGAENGLIMQQGNFHRIFVDDAGNASAHVVWQNIVFGAPWVMNVGTWVWDLAGTIFDTNQVGGFTVPELEIGTGGRILSSSRDGGVVTAVVDFNRPAKVGDSIFVRDLDTSDMNGGFTITEADDHTIKYNAPGVNVAAGGEGAFTNYAWIFPFKLKTRCVGPSPSVCQLKAWHGDDEPEWGDPYYGTSMSWESGHYSGYGGAGFLIAHPVAGVRLVQGRVEAYEL